MNVGKFELVFLWWSSHTGHCQLHASARQNSIKVLNFSFMFPSSMHTQAEKNTLEMERKVWLNFSCYRPDVNGEEKRTVSETFTKFREMLRNENCISCFQRQFHFFSVCSFSSFFLYTQFSSRKKEKEEKFSAFNENRWNIFSLFFGHQSINGIENNAKDKNHHRRLRKEIYVVVLCGAQHIKKSWMLFGSGFFRMRKNIVL